MAGILLRQAFPEKHVTQMAAAFHTEDLGSHVWDAPLKAPEDVGKLHPRAIRVDRQATARLVAAAEEVFGDILRVRAHHHIGWPASLTWTLIKLRGLNQVLMDIYDNPQLLHDVMAILRDDRLSEWDLLQREGVLALNNGPDEYVGSGGLGGTDEGVL